MGSSWSGDEISGELAKLRIDGTNTYIKNIYGKQVKLQVVKRTNTSKTPIKEEVVSELLLNVDQETTVKNDVSMILKDYHGKHNGVEYLARIWPSETRETEYAEIYRVAMAKNLSHPTIEIVQKRGGVQRGVDITYQTGDNDQQHERFDLLIICCNPAALGADDGPLQLTADEKKCYNAYTNFIFQTNLFRFPVYTYPEGSTNVNNIRFCPQSAQDMQGHLYGFRSETRMAVDLSKVEYEYVTMYQFLFPSMYGNMTEEEMLAQLDKEMKTGANDAWFPYDWSKRKHIKSYHTEYFYHFSLGNMQGGPPFNILDLQGQNSTFMLHASACHEAVFQVWQYIKEVMNKKTSLFPAEKDASIAIIGAGPSGLLAARRLSQNGYTNIKILEVLEKEGLIAGKTQSHHKHQDGKVIVCELGTCYLSPAYDPMLEDLEDCLVGNPAEGFQDAKYLGIVTTGRFTAGGPIMTLFTNDQLPGYPNPNGDATFPKVLNYTIYVHFKAFDEHQQMPTRINKITLNFLKVKLEEVYVVIAEDVIKYCMFHFKHFGTDRPIPKRQKLSIEFYQDIATSTISDFLSDQGLSSITGMLEYAYSVQGYGPLDREMPAWYLFVWITPESIMPALLDVVKEIILYKLKPVIDLLPPKLKALIYKYLMIQPVVRVFPNKGWGDVWKQQKALFEEGSSVQILYNTKVLKIIREGVSADHGTYSCPKSCFNMSLQERCIRDENDKHYSVLQRAKEIEDVENIWIGKPRAFRNPLTKKRKLSAMS